MIIFVIKKKIEKNNINFYFIINYYKKIIILWVIFSFS